MKKLGKKAIVLIGGIVLAIWMTGCGKQNLTEARKERLEAAERNIKLQNEMKRLSGELERQKDLLANCDREKQAGQTRIEGVLSSAIQMNAEQQEGIKKLESQIQELKKENENLKARVRELETELQKIKGPPGPAPLDSGTK